MGRAVRSSKNLPGNKHELRCIVDVDPDLPPREPSACGEGDGDGGIEVGAGDVAEGVHHGHDHEPPGQAYAGECDDAGA